MVKPETAASWLQKMVRAEAAIKHSQFAMVGGSYTLLEGVPIGECHCVTCGVRLLWSSPSYKGRQMQGGHWIPRSSAREKLLLLEDNVYPQCSRCNQPDDGGWKHGNKEAFDAFILHHLGFDRMREIEAMKRETLTKDEIQSLSDQYRIRYRTAREELDRYA